VEEDNRTLGYCCLCTEWALSSIPYLGVNTIPFYVVFLYSDRLQPYMQLVVFNLSSWPCLPDCLNGYNGTDPSCEAVIVSHLNRESLTLRCLSFFYCSRSLTFSIFSLWKFMHCSYYYTSNVSLYVATYIDYNILGILTIANSRWKLAFKNLII